MADHGAFIRSGTVTKSITPIGTFASNTGLPPESTTTSFLNESLGVFDGHDAPAGFTGLRQSAFSLTGGSSVVVSYLSLNSTPSGNDSTITPIPNSLTTNNVAGNSLPTPVGKHFKMIGYYATGAVYESFVVTGSPAPSTTVNPNTGHTLINTYVANIW